MWTRWFTPLLAAVALTGLAARATQIDVGGLLTSRFGFSAAEVADVRGGQPVAKLLPANDASDIGVFGAVRVQADAARLVAWVKDVAQFRRAAELGDARRLSDPPRIEDFADLALDAKDVEALRECRPGKCDLRLGDEALQRFQAEAWTAGDPAGRASALMRQLLLRQAQAYLAGGDAALGAAHNEKTPRDVAENFHQVLWQSKALYDVAAPLASYLEGFPSARLPQSEQFVYWAKSTLGSDPVIALRQMVVYHPASGQVYIADKQIYASRYMDAALAVISLSTLAGGSGFDAIVGVRARSAMLEGLGARVLRGTVERSARDTAVMYLTWIRQSLAG